MTCWTLPLQRAATASVNTCPIRRQRGGETLVLRRGGVGAAALVISRPSPETPGAGTQLERLGVEANRPLQAGASKVSLGVL